MQTKTREFKTFCARNQSFAAVAKAVTIINPNHEEFDSFVKKMEIDLTEVAVMATHSVGRREWDQVPDTKPRYLPEPAFGGGWYFFKEEEVVRLMSVSATSGSQLEAVRIAPQNWTIRVRLPYLEDGTLYKGLYLAQYEEATGQKIG